MALVAKFSLRMAYGKWLGGGMMLTDPSDDDQVLECRKGYFTNYEFTHFRFPYKIKFNQFL